MDEGRQQENDRHHADHHRGTQLQWNMLSQNQVKEQNAFFMSTKIGMLYAERDTAFEERDRALAAKKAALEERDMAFRERDFAISERDDALRERDNALAALHFQESTMSGAVVCSIKRDTKRRSRGTDKCQFAYNTREGHVTDALPITSISAEAAQSLQVKQTKVNKATPAKIKRSPHKVKKVRENMNNHVTTDGSKAEWDAQEFGSSNLINFDESTMPIPVCCCTGVPRQCYKWGSGGWQSSCCTMSISEYPLPQQPHKRHARIGGRKMSGSVFSRLLTRLAAAGHDLSVPLDLKSYWAKHGTNRYITIK
ncbi:hypothetical protein LIER_27571 [Lithospermum erythrorhizon]|uniref:GAGA-binding transcriptional activator n=1 Tax=Lithospermum erythrorhizon TaxID=34254 RepID=A0AAV3RIJ7_LITER